jgi:hypothetical protein
MSIYSCLASCDIEPVERFEEGDIVFNCLNGRISNCKWRVTSLFNNGYEEKHSVRVVVHATRCYYFTIKLNMLQYPDLFEPILENVTTTDPTLLCPNLWEGKTENCSATMVCDFYKVNRRALTEFIKTVDGERFKQEPSYKKSDCIQVITNLSLV